METTWILNVSFGNETCQKVMFTLVAVFEHCSKSKCCSFCLSLTRTLSEICVMQQNFSSNGSRTCDMLPSLKMIDYSV